jgi:hypothetical protein
MLNGSPLTAQPKAGETEEAQKTQKTIRLSEE